MVVLAELQPEGSFNCRWASWTCTEELQGGGWNTVPCAQLFPFLPRPAAEFKLAQKIVTKQKNSPQTLALPRRPVALITRERQMDWQMDQPENTTLAATAPARSETPEITVGQWGGAEEVDSGCHLCYLQGLRIVTCHSRILFFPKC